MEIRIFYPASYLPHKNHKQLIKAAFQIYKEIPEIKFILTIKKDIYNVLPPNISCIGNISRKRVINLMKKSDALIFLSSFESLGIPLIEAANVDLPIIVPQLPYALELLGSNAYYLDIEKDFQTSLKEVLKKFKKDLSLKKVINSSIQPKIISTDSLLKIFINILKN